ncbi:MAG: putative spermidine/putrescine transport system permease [Beijerinckiaceae bacterium]|nr:MAG: putative spermidine/putrescine transport system permease [Beijerinckiaceae bacterium]
MANPKIMASARTLTSEGLGERLGLFLLITPAILWLGLLVILPHVEIGILSLSQRIAARVYTIGFGNYFEFLSEPIYWHTFARTALLSILVTAITLVISFPVALYIAKFAVGKSKPILFLMCLIPFWASELVRTLGWMMLLREAGVVSFLLQWAGIAGKPVEMLYSDGSLVLGLVYGGMLFMIVPLTNALESLENAQIEAGYDLGGTNFTVLRKIIIPHAMPGIVAGAIIVFMLTVGNFVTPVMLGGKNGLWFTEQIYSQFITRFNWPQGSAFGFMLLLLSTGIVWLGLRLTGQGFSETLRRT